MSFPRKSKDEGTEEDRIVLCGYSRCFESIQMVTGPSLTRATCMSAQHAIYVARSDLPVATALTA